MISRAPKTLHPNGPIKRSRNYEETSPESDFNGKFNLAPNQQARCMGIGGALLIAICTLIEESVGKAYFKRQAPRFVIGRDGGKGDLIHPRMNPIEVDLNDLMPTGRILDAIGRGGALRFLSATEKFRMRYVVDFRTLVLWRNAGRDFTNNQTTWGIRIRDWAIM